MKTFKAMLIVNVLLFIVLAVYGALPHDDGEATVFLLTALSMIWTIGLSGWVGASAVPIGEGLPVRSGLRVALAAFPAALLASWPPISRSPFYTLLKAGRGPTVWILGTLEYLVFFGLLAFVVARLSSKISTAGKVICGILIGVGFEIGRIYIGNLAQGL